tara:strand:- start:3569 stop:4972 length:1404 start_codon:yes stop_codon:yes gene_type:complete
MIYYNIEEIKNLNFPVLIVGSGPAGISVALKLEEKKVKCLIIEAGDEEYKEDSQDFYKSKVIGDEITDLKYSRVRQFGGTSNQWGGWSKPMEEYNLSSWDIETNELKKYAEQTCKILEIKNQFRKSNLDENFNQIEFQYSKVNFKEKYKNHIKKSKYINLVLNTQIINFDGEENKTKSVMCIFNNKKYQIKSDYFVLATGGVENSRILLWTRQTTDLIDKKIPIGENWMTHPWFIVGHGILRKNDLAKYLGKKFIDINDPLHIASSKFFKEKNLLSGSLYMNSFENEKLHKEIIKDILCVAPKLGKKLARSFFKKDLKCGNIFFHFEELPNPSNKIVLDKNTKDKNDVPITNLFYKKSNFTIKKAKMMIEDFANTCRKLDLGRVGIDKKIYELKDYDSLGVYHHLGGTGLGKNKNTSVVDPDLRLHNNKNLFVTGSSVFPTSGYTNPTFTIIQLSLRLGEHISKKII